MIGATAALWIAFRVLRGQLRVGVFTDFIRHYARRPCQAFARLRCGLALYSVSMTFLKKRLKKRHTRLL